MAADLTFDILALDKASKTFVKLAQTVERLERKLDKLDRKDVDVDVDVDVDRPLRGLRRLEKATVRASRTVRLTQRGLVSLIGAVAALAPVVLAAGAAFGAFGAVAAPSIIKVVQSQTELGKHWDSLSAQQARSARMLTGLVERYKELNRQFEPQALRAFNNTLATGNTLMRQMTPLMRAGGDALVSFTARMNAEFADPQWTRFFGFLASEAPRAVNLVGDAMFATLGAVRDLTRALAPLSAVTLQTVTGLLKMVGGVAQAHPALVQMAAVALLLRAPFIAARNAAILLAQKFIALETGAARARAALSLLAKAAAIGGLVLLVQRFANAASEADKFADTVAGRGRDVESQIAALNVELARQNRLASEGVNLFDTIYSSQSAKNAADRVDAIKSQIADLKAQRRADAQAAQLEADVQGTLSAALAAAADETRLMEDRLKALKTALDAVFNPSINVFNATTQLKAGYDELAKAIKKAEGNFKGNTEASRTLRDAFARQLTTVGELFEATLQQTGSIRKARQAAKQHIPVLQALAGNNKGAQRQVRALARSLGVNTGAARVNRKEFIRSARQMGLTKGQANRLWKEYRKIPKRVRTGVRTPGMSQAIARAMALRSTISSIPRNVRISMHARVTSSLVGPGSMTGLQHGGPARKGVPVIVGEKRPELFVPDTNGTVHPRVPPRSHPVPFGGGGRVVLEIRSGGSRMDDLLVETLRRSVRTRGGDVQVVLGSR